MASHGTVGPAYGSSHLMNLAPTLLVTNQTPARESCRTDSSNSRTRCNVSQQGCRGQFPGVVWRLGSTCDIAARHLSVTSGSSGGLWEERRARLSSLGFAYGSTSQGALSATSALRSRSPTTASVRHAYWYPRGVTLEPLTGMASLGFIVYRICL